MATLRQIKEKQTSVSTINKITKAMKLVASAKSQKAIKLMKDYKEYFRKIESVMSDLVEEENQFNSKGTYWILVMSDLGLAGGYNSNVLKKLKEKIKSNDSVLILGNKGISFAKKNRSNTESLSISELTTNPNFLSTIITKIKSMHYDDEKDVKIIYTEYKSQVEFQPVIKKILPIEKIEIEDKKNNDLTLVEYEPSKEVLVKELENLYIQAILVGIYREAQASEHTSRKNAMDNATNNGIELLEKLDIEYNRGRQAKITQEISEIISGAESLN